MELIKEMCLTAGFTLWLLVVLFLIGEIYDRRRCRRDAAPTATVAEHHAGRITSVRFWLGVLEDPDATEVEHLVARELLDAHFDQDLVARTREEVGPARDLSFTNRGMPTLSRPAGPYAAAPR